MDADTFTDLALRVMTREATEDDRRALEAELESTPARRDEFEQLRITHDLLRTAAPAAEVAVSNSTVPELPAHRVGELRTAVRQHFGPAAAREKSTAGSPLFRFLLRWLFGTTGAIGLGFAIFLAFFANRDVEFGAYADGQVRGSDQPITATDAPGAKFVSFNGDTSFEQWQAAPLAWNEHAKVWIDNEADQIHIVRRVRMGQILRETRPLAPTPDGQRDQLRQLMAELER
jgi:hypothetical protein